MKKGILKGNVISLISTGALLLVGIMAAVLEWMTGYYLYFFLKVSGFLLGSTNLLFILLRWIQHRSEAPKRQVVKRKKKSKNKVAEEEDGQEVQKPKKKHLVNVYLVAKAFSYIAYTVIFYYSSTATWTYIKTMKTASRFAAVNGVLALILFVVFVILDRVCKYAPKETPFAEAIHENNRIFYKLLCFQSLFGTLHVVFDSLQLFDVQKYVIYIYGITFYYFIVFICLSLVVVIIRKEMDSTPYLSVPLPMTKKEKAGRKGFVDYLESNTGISMRSLWSVKYIRQIAPMVVFLSGIFLWLSTCIVQVEPYQKAAVYRMGVLQDKILDPGIHLALPYPFDKVEIYDTEVVNKITIGYRSEESTDNIWTGDHGKEEHKLLLGGGEELVSINLRLEYKIGDLEKYLKTTSSPVKHMEALAYELVTDQTIATDLDSLLSADRHVFASNFKEVLGEEMKKRELGIEVVGVVLESIHPPVEIASAYQELISAEISAQKFLLYAEGNANETIAWAEKNADTIVLYATVDYEHKIAAAKASVAEFLGSVEAYGEHKDAYTYQKYLKAIQEAYGDARLVILGDGINESMLYFGNIVGVTSE